jgi:hypothetical protein
MATKWAKEAAGKNICDVEQPAAESLYKPKQIPGLEERIGEAAMANLISRFLAGTTQDERARYYGTTCKFSL